MGGVSSIADCACERGPGGESHVFTESNDSTDQNEHLESIMLGLWKSKDALAATDTLIKLIMTQCPDANEAKIREGLQFNKDGSLHNWDMCECNLEALPELFGTLRATGYLYLARNNLTSLPESFGNIRVGGDLALN